MKRSPGSPTYGGGPPKRFETMRSSPQRQLQTQMHQQIHQMQQHQQHHQQYGASAGVVSKVPFFPNIHTPPPGMPAMNGMNAMNGMMPYSSPTPATNPYHYSANVGMQARMWKYSMPPTPATPPINFDMTKQPPLPLVPPQQPPLPPMEPEPPNYASINTSIPPPNMLAMNTSIGSPRVTEHEEMIPFSAKKSKRKSMSSRSGCLKQWDREDALKAIALENEYSNKAKSKILLLRFPDPELSRDIVSKYSPHIQSVHFQQNSAPRFCFVHLKDDADIDAVSETLSKIPFGNGFIQVERKRMPLEDGTQGIIPEEVDPYTLYVGNLPTTISSRTVKEHFPGAQRIDIGHALRMKYTRYAFVRYHTVEESMAAFRKCAKTLIESRSPIIRFRRFPPSEQKIAQRKEAAAAGNFVKAASVVQEMAAATEGVDTASVADVAAQQVEHHESKATETTSNATAIDESNEKKQPNGQHEGSSSTAFDSPNSLEEPEQLPLPDSKDRVFQEAELLKRKMSGSNGTTAASATACNNVTTTSSATTAANEAETITSSAPTQRRSSIEEMFEQLEQRSRQLENKVANAVPSKPTPAIKIKKETYDFEEPSEDEEPSLNQMSLLGARYRDNAHGDSQIKSDPDASPMREEEPHMFPDEMYQDDFEYDDEYDSEPEETVNNAAWSKHTKPKIPADSNSNSANSHTSWDVVRKRELDEDIESKPAVEELHRSGFAIQRKKPKSCLPFPFPAHPSDIEKLYEQQRQFKKREESKRPRDDLDDMFARMNSDTEEDEDDFF